MLKRIRFPIRLKILVTLLLVVTVVVSVITFTMARLFHEDKRTYIHDLSSIVALSTAEECRTLLNRYREQLQFYARVMTNPELDLEHRDQLLRELFDDFEELVAVSLYEHEDESMGVWDTRALEQAGLSKAALQESRAGRPLPFERIRAGELFVENSTVSPELPTLTLAFAQPGSGEGPDPVISSLIRLDGLMRLARTSRAFDVFITDADGLLLAHRNPRWVTRRSRIDFVPHVTEVPTGFSAGVTREYFTNGMQMVGGFAGVEPGGLMAGAQIPKSAAYLASRDLLRNLLGVELILLVLATLISLFWARRITRPVERLSEATRRIAQGRFDVQVRGGTSDEMGTLARSFNQMASELQRREQALQQAQAALVQSEKMAAFGQLGAGIAHEVKNPLAGILGCAQLSLRKAEEDTPIHRNLLLIEKETKRCKTIIEGLLRFARQEKAVFSEIDVGSVVDDAIAIVSHQLEMHQVKLEKEISPGLPPIRGNANQLQQVLMNLFMNAQQAMEGGPGLVRVSARPLDDGQIEIRVLDDGPGMPPDVRAKIFEPFFTTKPGGRGTGLGLSVSFGIIKDHKGEIAVESEVGRGTTFVIKLPAVVAERSAGSAEQARSA